MGPSATRDHHFRGEWEEEKKKTWGGSLDRKGGQKELDKNDGGKLTSSLPSSLVLSSPPP